MPKYEMLTRNGYNFYDMSSLLQKAIRRSKYELAGFAANELMEKYRNYLWKRLLIISAEDCYGIMTKEIIALKLAADEVRKSQRESDSIFVSKAITLLCLAKKNRDACYFACNFLTDDNVLNPDEIRCEKRIEDCDLVGDTIPDWVFDVHTLKGKMMGKTLRDMIADEQEALEPKQMSMFDDAEWTNFLKNK